MRLRAMLASIVFVAGCAMHPLAGLESGMRRLLGQPASVAFSKLGYPTSEATVAGRKFYVWSRETNAMDAYSCKIRVFVDKDEIITDGDYDGNLGGCANYIDRLQ